MSARRLSRARRAPSREQVAAALRVLPELDRVVLTLRLVDGLSPLETAGSLQISMAAVERRTTAALRALAHELGVEPGLGRVA